MLTYFVLEIQADITNRAAMIPYAFDTRPEAEEKYHQILAAAAVSNVPYHTAVMIGERGQICAPAQTYEHKITNNEQ